MRRQEELQTFSSPVNAKELSKGIQFYDYLLSYENQGKAPVNFLREY